MCRSSVPLFVPGEVPLQLHPPESHNRARLSRATPGSPFRGLAHASSHLPGHHSTECCRWTLPASHEVMKLFPNKKSLSLHCRVFPLDLRTHLLEVYFENYQTNANEVSLIDTDPHLGVRGFPCNEGSTDFPPTHRSHRGSCTGPRRVPSRCWWCDEV